MKLARRNFLRLAGGAATLPAVSRLARAQAYPVRPVTIVVPFAAGGSTDVLARILSPHLAALLGQPVVIENVTGAGGMTGSARVAKSPPDGYQLVFGTQGTHAQNQSLYRNPLYNAATDFAPVVLVAELPLVLATRRSLPVADLQQFMTYAKANQGNMQYGSAGAGSGGHLACVLLNAAMKINVTHVPYRGEALAIQDLVAGRIDYQCVTATTAKPQFESKTVNVLAVLPQQRSAALPNVPAAQEQGLTNFHVDAWFAMFLPRDTPAAIVKRLHDAIVAAMDTPAVQERFDEVGATVIPPDRRSPQYLQNFVVNEIERWAGPIKASGVAMD